MDSHREYKVSSECRGLLKFMHLCIKTKIHHGSKEIANFFVFAIQSVPQSFAIVLESLNAYDIGLDFENCSVAFMILLGTIQIQLHYFCLICRNDVLIETIDRIQDIVDRSILLASTSLN